MRQYLIAAVVCFVIAIVALLFMGCAARPVEHRHYLSAGDQIEVVLCPPGDPMLVRPRVGLIEYWLDLDDKRHCRIYVYGEWVDGYLWADMSMVGHEFWHWVEWNNRGEVLNPDKYR